MKNLTVYVFLAWSPGNSGGMEWHPSELVVDKIEQDLLDNPIFNNFLVARRVFETRFAVNHVLTDEDMNELTNEIDGYTPDWEVEEEQKLVEASTFIKYNEDLEFVVTIPA